MIIEPHIHNGKDELLWSSAFQRMRPKTLDKHIKYFNMVCFLFNADAVCCASSTRHFGSSVVVDESIPPWFLQIVQCWENLEWFLSFQMYAHST